MIDKRLEYGIAAIGWDDYCRAATEIFFVVFTGSKFKVFIRMKLALKQIQCQEPVDSFSWPSIIWSLLYSRKPFSYLLSAILISAFALPAQAQSPAEQMMQLNALGRPQQAYQLGSQLLSQFEGEPSFDLHYGVAAIDSGFASEGAFALERVLMNEPANDYARLELARAYFILEEDDRAREEFEAVLDTNPPQDVIDRVQPYLRAIDSRAAWRETTYFANVELGGGYDSNILAAPDNNDLAPGVTLGNQAESDSFLQARTDFGVNRPIKYGTNLFLTGNATKRENNSNQFNLQTFGLQTGVVHRSGAHNFRLALQTDIVDLQSNKYRDSFGVNGSWQYNLSLQASLTAFAQLSEQDFNREYRVGDGRTSNLDFRDSVFALGGLSYRYRFNSPLSPVATVSLTAGRNDADDDNASGALENVERDILGLNASSVFTLRRNLTLTGSASYQRSQYAAPDNVLPLLLGSDPVVRDDKQYRASLALSWTPVESLLIRLDSAISSTRSNIPIVEYDREQLTLSIRYMYR